VEHLRAGGVRALHPRCRIAEARGEHVDPLSEDLLDRVGRLDLEDHVDADGAVCESPDLADAGSHLVRRVARGAGHAEPTGIRHRRGEARARDRPRAGADDGKLDAHHLGEAGAEGGHSG
jgi:hypothetical protein